MRWKIVKFPSANQMYILNIADSFVCGFRPFSVIQYGKSQVNCLLEKNFPGISLSSAFFSRTKGSPDERMKYSWHRNIADVTTNFSVPSVYVIEIDKS